ncbi:hypothetical protein VPHPS15B6_0020 [Vibrio phage PS15B-6]
MSSASAASSGICTVINIVLSLMLPTTMAKGTGQSRGAR